MQPAPAPAPVGPPLAAPAGRVRNAGINILLYVVTLGVYWFYWLYQAFTEVARSQRRDLKAGLWILALVVLHVAAIATTAYLLVGYIDDLPRDADGNIDFENLPELDFGPLQYVVSALDVAFYVVQLFYVRNVTQMVKEAGRPLGERQPPNPALAITFCLLLAGGAIPFVGLLFTLGGYVVAIIWIIQVQGAMNRYWQHLVGWQQFAAYPGYAPPAPPAPAPAPPPAPAYPGPWPPPAAAPPASPRAPYTPAPSVEYHTPPAAPPPPPTPPPKERAAPRKKPPAKKKAPPKAPAKPRRRK